MVTIISKKILKSPITKTFQNTLSKQFSSLIKDNELFKTELGGGDSQNWFKIENPATLETLGYCQECKVGDLRESINIAHSTFWNKGWKSWTPQARSQALTKFYDLLIKNEEDLAKLCTLENGKSLVESRGEVKYAASFLQWFASEAVRTYGDVTPSPSPAHRLLTIKQPVGVVGIITPWNFPLAMITRKLGPALAAGCTTVIKPAAETPLCALALQRLAYEAGFPEGSINIVTADNNTKDIGKEMCSNSKLSKISFTGSTAVGRLLMSESGHTVKRVSMELGGNAPFVVFEDADIDNAVESAMSAKFRNSGQTCISPNRFIVHSKIHDQFVERLAMRMEQTLKVGNGMEKGINIGPLINQKGMDKVLRHIKNAQSNGAKLILGGNRIGDTGTFVEPTLLTNLTKSMDIHCEETFGPVVAVIKFEEESEALQLANDTEFGLASYFFSKDIDRIWRVAEQLQSGMVAINTGSVGFASTPFGGIKQSGVGVEGSKYGIDEYLSKKLLSMGINNNL